jgi:hypothetical protein
MICRRKLCCVLLTLCAITGQCVAQAIDLLLPLKGIPGQDYWIAYGVDHDTSKGVQDAYCGTKTYDQHKGTDFQLRSFETMDSGVYIYAIADGVVFKAIDSSFDRNTQWRQNGFGNYLIIRSGELMTYYGHLMRGSLMVNQGDLVTAGQPIAKVGSSGRSDNPHLHLELVNSAYQTIDPFISHCNPQPAFKWKEQPPYDTAVYPIEFGFAPYVPDLGMLKERQGLKDTFFTDSDSIICFWVQAHGLKKGDRLKAVWYAPDGTAWYEYVHIWPANLWYDYGWFYIDMPKRAGKWSVVVQLNGRRFAADKLYLVKGKPK